MMCLWLAVERVAEQLRTQGLVLRVVAVAGTPQLRRESGTMELVLLWWEAGV